MGLELLPGCNPRALVFNRVQNALLAFARQSHSSTMSRVRAASEEPATDAVKRSGDTSFDELASAKRPRLSDYRVLEKSQFQQNRIVSEDSDNGGVRCVSHTGPTSVESERKDEDESIALIAGPSSCGEHLW